LGGEPQFQIRFLEGAEFDAAVDAFDGVKNFFSTHKVAASDLALKHAIERIDGCIELRALQEPNLKLWLAAQPKP
jgi:aminopeptidase N/puromycin-sensitive aminopeptidase